MHTISRRRLVTSLAALGTSAILPEGGASAQTAPARRMIDVHHHFYPPTYRDALVEFAQKNPGNGVPPFVRTWTPARTLEVMDQGGVSTAILSIATIPANWFNGNDAEKRRWARLCNDYVAGLARDNPGRFGIFAAMPMPDVAGTLAEIAYALDTLKADGIGFMTSFGDKWPGDPTFGPVWEELNRRKAIAYFHPASPLCCTVLADGVPPSFLEYPYDTGRAVLSLLFSGTFSKYPDVKWLFSHNGGPIPVFAGRVNSLSSFQGTAKNLPNGIDYELKRLYYETANSAYKGTMAALLDYVPISQVMFGTDFPYVSVDENVSGIHKCGLSNAQLAAISRDNAMRLMPRWRA
ncbi:MAG TPA: amidohydrolase family protein [Candidatus Binatia bacterium]|nr:amidohydrolase family protein [Candidatus Binatia bacterium]